MATTKVQPRPCRMRWHRLLAAALAAVFVVGAVLSARRLQPVDAAGSAASGAASAGQKAVRLAPPPPPFPTEETTGVPAGTSLTPWPWQLRTSAGSAATETHFGMTCRVFDGYLISLSGNGVLLVDSECVIFRRSRFQTTGNISYIGAMVQQGPGNKYLEFDSSDFDGGPYHQRGIVGFYSDIVVVDCEFKRFGQAGVELNNTSGTASLTVEDSYFYETPGWPQEYHVDGIQVGAGENITIRHNTVLVEPWGGAPGNISYGSNSALGLWAELGNVTGSVVVDGNLLAGGGYVIYVEQKAPYSWRGPVSITNNVFDQRFFATGGIWGPLYPHRTPSNFTWSGNAWSNGVAISLQAALNNYL